MNVLAFMPTWLLVVAGAVLAFSLAALAWFYLAPGGSRYHSHLYRQRLFWWQRHRRDEPPFKLFIGKRGRGKSLALTRETQLEMARGSYVLANCDVYDPLTGQSAHQWVSVGDLMERVAAAVLRDERRIIIVVDEAQNHFDARDWEKTPRWFRQFLAESRHYHVGVLAATQAISQVDKRFRILCDQIIRVRPVLEGAHHRFALYRYCAMDENFDSTDEEAKELGTPWLVWVTARAYGGYSTAALPTEEEFGDGDQAAITALIEKTREHVSGSGPSAAAPESA